MDCQPTSMVDKGDAGFGPRLHTLLLLIPTLLLLGSCTGSAPATTPPEVIGDKWPPAAPKHPERLATPLPSGADPLVWWKATFFDPLPPSIYPDQAMATLAHNLITQTNKARADNGLPAVSEDLLLDRVAQAHAVDQGIRDYWNHKNPEGMGSHDRVMAASGITVTAGAENSAVESIVAGDTAQVVITAFLNHPGHRELLLNPAVTKVGFGVYRYAPGEFTFVVQLLMAY